MSHKKIRIPRESAEEIMRSLGRISNSIEFVDLTKDDVEAKKNFYGQTLKRCEEITSKINDLESISNDFHQPLVSYKTYREFAEDLELDMKEKNAKTGSNYFDIIEAEIMENDRKVKDSVHSHGQIRESLTTLIEKKHVLKKLSELVYTNQQFRQSFGDAGSSTDGVSSGSGLNFLAGTINTLDTIKMKRMIHRISRGRAIASFYDLEIDKEEFLFTASIRQRGFSFADEAKQEEEKELSNLIKIKPIMDESRTSDRKIFNIIFQGSGENILLNKILKVCEIFQASRYAIPKSSELPSELQNIEKEIYEKKELLVKTEISLRDLLQRNVSVIYKGKGSKYSLFKLFFVQEKMVFSTLNKCIIRETFIDGEIWIPTAKVDNVKTQLRTLFGEDESKLTATITDINPDEILEEEVPPTYIETNQFVYAFQLIVSTYGTPRYREINPAYFTIITFPFMFGIMFGDIGHGLILFLFSLYVCIFNNYYENSQSSLKMVLPARYLLLFMGFFAFYCGLMYNDFLSIPLDFTSCYDDVVEGEIKVGKRKDSCTYKFGLDPKWYSADNELQFVNSLKMKLSVIFGVAHMTLGIFLNGCNFIFNNQILQFVFVFIPQLILMIILFGYMDFLIYVKWATPWQDNEKKENWIGNAPDIKSILMDIFLGITKDIKFPLWGNATQMKGFHVFVLVGSLICIILMLLPTAIIEHREANKKYADYLRRFGLINRPNQSEEGARIMDMGGNQEEILVDEGNNGGNGKPLVAKEAPKFSETFVHVIIETIEFVLGTVSNTASYLRLWALSLAHSQLSVVFFDKTIQLCATLTNIFIVNIFALVIIFFVFAAVTVGVLLLMDLMECFLHTLRLHWVEFQNKFFKADGYEFKPFSFEKIVVPN